MANYKVVFRSDNQSAAGAPGWEPGCPLLINAMQVSRNTDSGQCYLQLKLSNISGEVVNSYELKAAVTYADGTTETVELRPLDADIAPGKNYRPDPVALTGSEVANVTARIGATSQASGCWQSAEAPGAIPAGEPVALEGSAAIERSRTFADLGKSPERYQRHLVEGDTWWVCPCGMPNVGRATCCACGIPHDTLHQLEDETSLNAKASERTAKRNRGKAKVIIGTIAAAAALAAVGFGVVNGKYSDAMALYDAGDYLHAITAFSEMGDFSDASEMAEKSTQKLNAQAQEAYDRGDYATAHELFSELRKLDVSGAARMEDRSAAALSTLSDIQTYLNADLSGKFGIDDKVDYEQCVFRLNSDGTCAVLISDLAQEEFNGTWAGHWDAGARTITLQGFPGGEEWSIDSEAEVKRIKGSSRTGTGEMYLPLRSDNGYFFLYRP